MALCCCSTTLPLMSSQMDNAMMPRLPSTLSLLQLASRDSRWRIGSPPRAACIPFSPARLHLAIAGCAVSLLLGTSSSPASGLSMLAKWFSCNLASHVRAT